MFLPRTPDNRIEVTSLRTGSLCPFIKRKGLYCIIIMTIYNVIRANTKHSLGVVTRWSIDNNAPWASIGSHAYRYFMLNKNCSTCPFTGFRYNLQFIQLNLVT